MLTSVIEQTLILLAMGWLLTINVRKGRHHPRLLILTTGFWFGVTAVVCMLLPFNVAPGVLLDARNGVMFVAGLFGGPVSGALAALIAGGFRFWIGGEGAATGVLNILIAVGFGLGYRHFVSKGWLRITFSHLLPMVLLLHLVTVALITMLMTPENREVLPTLVWSFIMVMVPLTLMLTQILRDAELRRREQVALQNGEARLRAITAALPDLMCVMDEDGRFLEVMSATPDQHYPVTGEVTGRTVNELFPPAQARMFADFIHRALEQDSVSTLIHEVETEEGSRTFESMAQAMDTGPAARRAVVVLTRDITQRVKNETELRIAAVAFESFEGMLVTDAHNRILKVNQAFTDITGYSPEEVIGKTPAMFSSGQHDQSFYQQMWNSITEYGHWQGEICNKRKSGHVYPQWLSISAVRDGQGEVSHFVASITDITQRKKDAERINHLAFYDITTGLPNRRLLNERIERCLNEHDGTHAALIFIDLDNFKDINDLWGIPVGDQLLQQAAQRLNKAVREQDIVARPGGDEFIVLLTGLSADKVRAANYLEQVGDKLLTVLEQPYVHENHVLRCSASLGLVVLENQQLSADELVQQAELAMYDAKSGGKGKLRFFDPLMQEVVADRLRLEEDIKRGLEAQEFAAWFQPQFDFQGNIIGAEALVRWHHPERGVLAPGAFISVADEAGLMNHIDRMVLQQSCEQMAAWSRLPSFGDFTLSVNISAARLYQPDFIEDALGIFHRSGVNPANIKLEITESMLLDDMPRAIERMQLLREQGVRFAIDDFGTGYSSLLYLQQLPLDQLKIDQSFVRVLPGDENSLNIIKAIVALAESLGLEVIAEGVETEAQRQLLHQHGCQHYQGYLLSRPEPAEVVEGMLQQRHCSETALVK